MLQVNPYFPPIILSNTFSLALASVGLFRPIKGEQHRYRLCSVFIVGETFLVLEKQQNEIQQGKNKIFYHFSPLSFISRCIKQNKSYLFFPSRCVCPVVVVWLAALLSCQLFQTICLPVCSYFVLCQPIAVCL